MIDFFYLIGLKVSPFLWPSSRKSFSSAWLYTLNYVHWRLSLSLGKKSEKILLLLSIFTITWRRNITIKTGQKLIQKYFLCAYSFSILNINDGQKDVYFWKLLRPPLLAIFLGVNKGSRKKKSSGPATKALQATPGPRPYFDQQKIMFLCYKSYNLIYY